MGLIPAYQAADTVGRVVRGSLRHLGHVLVVDDGSTDGTSAAAREAGAVVISHARNRGKGYALKTGFLYALKAGYDAVVTLDADTQHDPEEIPKLLEKAGEGEIVLGARLREKTVIPKARYWTNMVGVRCISWRAKAALDDSQSGFRLYKAGVLEGVKFRGGRFEGETELIIRAGRKGFRIVNVPVKAIYTPDILCKSHYRAVRDTYRICMMFLRSFFWL
ncbi:MAG: glycosyltransferase family 2 protein [Nitrospirota bacterium]